MTTNSQWMARPGDLSRSAGPWRARRRLAPSTGAAPGLRFARAASCAAVLIFAPGASPASSQSVARLTLSEAVGSALARHPAVAASRAAVDEAREAAGEAAASYFPSLAVAGSATRYEEPALVVPIHGFGPESPFTFDRTLFQASANLSYLLFDGGGREARVRRTRSEAEAAEAALAVSEQALVSRVLASYLEAIGSRETLEAHGHRLEALGAELDRVRRFSGVGRAASLEVLRVEAAIADAEADRVALQAGLATAERDLARLIGRSPEETKADRLEAVTLADAVAATREIVLEESSRASPALAQARRQLAAARAGRSAARGARWPEIRVGASLIEFADASGHDANEWNAGVRLSLPLFTGGEISRRIDRSEAAARAGAEHLRLAEMDLEQQIDRSLAAAAEARARTESLAKAVERFEEVVRVERLLLDNGAGTQTSYLDAEADLLAARARLVETRHAEVRARAELARAAGRLDTEWIMKNLEAQP